MRVLAITQPGDGHLNPMVPVAHQLLSAGHEVQVATSPSYVPDVERVGLAAVGIGPGYRWDSALQTWPDATDVPPEESALFWAQRVNRDVTIPFMTDLRDLVRATRPTLILGEYASGPWAQAIGELEHLPYVVTAWASEPGYDQVTVEASGGNVARAELGLPETRQVDPARWVSFTPPSWGALDGPALPTTRRYQLPTEASDNPVPGSTDHPFVYATLGTVFNTTRSLLKSIIAAIDAGGWAGLVTVGRTNDPDRFSAPDRVAVEQYVAQVDVLAQADVMVCHGGLGSMLGAIAAGCPIVVVPLGADQLHNARRAQTLGIASIVEPADATPDRLRGAIAEAIESPGQRSACATLRREVASLPDLFSLVADLEGLTS